MENLIFSPEILESLGKLSVEVVSILVLATIVRWISRSNNALAISHKTLSESHKKIAESHEKLIKNNQTLTSTVRKVAQAVRQDVELTKSLISSIDETKCHFKAKKNIP